MRRLVGIVVLAALLWAGYWFVAARGLEAGLTAWLDARRAEGWVADYDAITVRGFPNRLDTTIDDIALADPDTGLAWQAPFFQILALSYKPNHVIAAWPPEQVLATPREKLTISSGRMRGSVVFRPGTDLVLERSSFVLDGFAVESDLGWRMAAEKALFATRAVPARTNVHEIGLEARTVTPSAEFMSMIAQTGVPEVFERLKIDAELEFDRPWDRFAIEDRRPQLTGLKLKTLTASWGDLELQAAGTLSVDASGRPSGEIGLRATNWREMLQIAVATGALPRGLADTLESGLSVLAELSGRRDTLDVPLSFGGGLVRLGPVPLGPAPDLTIR